MTCFTEYDSPVGPLLLSGDARALTGLAFMGERTRIPLVMLTDPTLSLLVPPRNRQVRFARSGSTPTE